MTLPMDNLDDKSFDDLVRDALARIPVFAPQWTDHNKTDPGITLIELLAWIVEMQIYRLNKVSDRSYLKFLKLLGIMGLEPARAAVADLTFTVPKDRAAPSGQRILAYTQVAASDPATGKDIIFETDQNLSIAKMSLMAVLTIKTDGSMLDNTEANESESRFYSAFEGNPSIGDALYIGLDSSPKKQELTMAFYLSPDSTVSVSCDSNVINSTKANLVWEYYKGKDTDKEWKNDSNWKDLTKKAALDDDTWEAVLDETCDLALSGKAWIRVGGDPTHATINGHDLYWIRLRVAQPDYDMPPIIEGILLNVVSATQKTTTSRAKFSSTGLPGLQISLGNGSIIKNSLKVSIGDESLDWTQVEDLDASGPGDRHYTLDPISGTISFGDGIRGKIPAEGGNNIIVTFSSGGGIRGNVAPGAINKILDSSLSQMVQVQNKRAAYSGSEPGTLEDAIGRARGELRGVYRAVTPADYESIALKTPGIGVARAKAIPMYHSSQAGNVQDTMTLIVVPKSLNPMPIPSLDLLKTVYRYLDQHRTIGIELFVIPPIYIKVSVQATAVRLPTFGDDTVKKSILDSLNSFLSPFKGGGSDGNGWPFGRPVYLSEMYALLDRVKGVDYIKSLTLAGSTICKPAADTDNGGKPGQPIQCIVDVDLHGDIQMPAYGLACSGDHAVTVNSEAGFRASQKEPGV